MPSSAKKEASGQLLQELEALTQALYKGQSLPSAASKDFEDRVASSRRRASEVVASRSDAPVVKLGSRHSISAINPAAKVDKEDSELPEWIEENLAFSQSLEAPIQKKSFWDWKPLRALAHIGQQRYHCEFSAHVHGIEKLPASMNGLRLQVKLQHKEAEVHTEPSRSSNGSVEFEETMQFRSTVYGSKKSNGSIKYTSKSFDLLVVAADAPELDLGKHRLDLTRILPATTAPAVEGNNIWNTSFKLSGKAKGSLLWITFSHELLDGNNKGSKYGTSPAMRSARDGLRSFSSLPSSPQVGDFASSRKKTASVDFGSPAMPVPESDFHVDKLNLDDSPPKPIPEKPAAKHNAFGMRGRPLFPHLEPSAVATSQKEEFEEEPIDEPEKNYYDETAEFNVVEKGVEAGATDQLEANQVDRNRFEVDQVAQPDASLYLDEYEDANRQDIAILDKGYEEEPQLKSEQDEEKVLAAADQRYFKEDEHEEREEVGLDEYGFGVEEIEDWKKQEADKNDELAWTKKDVRQEEQYPNAAWDERQTQEHELILGDEQRLIMEDEQELVMEDEQEQIMEEEEQERIVEDEHQQYASDELENANAAVNHSTDVTKTYESSDDEDLVAGEFLQMLEPSTGPGEASSDGEITSPRAMLLKQFEHEAGFELEVDDSDNQVFSKPKQEQEEGNGWINEDEDKDLAAIMDAAETELQKANQAMRSKARAKMLEDAEAEALLQEWGLNEKAFQGSPPSGRNAMQETDIFSNSLVVRQELPPLAPGMGTVVPTSDGGSLRSMNAGLFQASSNNGQLVMHVSKPVVVPAEMGSTAMDVLQNLASGGTEIMAAQAMQAMPLEDITGKSVQQIAMEGQACFEDSKRRYTAALNALEYEPASTGTLLPRGSSSGLVPGGHAMPERQQRQQNSSSSSSVGDFLSLEELAPVAMEKIETLAMQGLKIQCDMAETEAPYTIEAGVSGSMQLLEGGKAAGAEESLTSDGMIAMSLSLDEWMKLDAGIYDEEETNEKTMAVLAAHGAAHRSTTTDLILNVNGDDASNMKRGPGKLGDTLTLAMLVQLRDPLRNYEPVGAPMMALVEAERVLVPPKPRLFKRVGLRGNAEDEYTREEEEAIKVVEPQFKITGVHVAGLKADEESKKTKSSSSTSSSSLWGSAKQQQSGSRWLVASGMGKSGSSAKHPLLKSSKASGGWGKQQTQSSESLWSLSSRLGGGAAGGDGGGGSSGGGGFSRNPNVKFGFKKR